MEQGGYAPLQLAYLTNNHHYKSLMIVIIDNRVGDGYT
jgi:hypothetical protein